MSQFDIYDYNAGRFATDSTNVRNKDDTILVSINVLLKNNTSYMSVFQNSLLKIYSARNVNYEFSAVAVNFGTQPLHSIKIISHNQRKIITTKTKTQQILKNLLIYIQMRNLNFLEIND